MRDRLCQLTFVFDLDNTLVETDLANNLSYMDAISEVLGVHISWDKSRRFTRNQLYSIFPNLPKEVYDSIIMVKNELFNSHMSETTLNMNLVKVLQWLHDKGFVTLLLTNSHRARALSICEYYDISPLFSETFFAEDKKETKYELLEKNGYEKSSVVLFENETEGTQEAMENGIAERNIINVKF